MKQSPAPAHTSSRLSSKTLAVGSGKGGVGKSITAVNLAVCFARQGMRAALCDLDPLSDTAVILDIRTPEEMLSSDPAGSKAALEDFILPVLPRLDILFPAAKTAEGQSATIRELIFHRFAAELDRRYDIIIFDLPAGIGAEENLSFLPRVNNLVVVTNPEPTSHVSAGGYIRAALDIHPAIRVHLWHNRYHVDSDGTFNTRAVVANYNRFVDPELQITSDEAGFKDLAFVPEDPSLNLLKGGLPVTLPVIYRLKGALEGLNERIVMTAPLDGGLDKVSAKLLRYHVARIRPGQERSAAEVVGYLEAFLPRGGTFEAGVQNRIEAFYNKLLNDETRSSLLAALAVFEKTAEELLEKDRLFAPKLRGIRKGSPDAAMAVFFKTFVRSKYYRDRYLRYSAGLVLYYYALYRLLQAKTVSDLFSRLLPVRKEGNRSVRDRRRQISFLLEKDEEYHRRYFEFIKKLFPVALKQLDRIASSLGVRNLVLPDSRGKMNRNAYLRLLADVIQDTLNSGLGILSGQRFNDASREMEKGARKLRSVMFGDSRG